MGRGRVSDNFLIGFGTKCGDTRLALEAVLAAADTETLPLAKTAKERYKLKLIRYKSPTDTLHAFEKNAQTAEVWYPMLTHRHPPQLRRRGLAAPRTPTRGPARPVGRAVTRGGRTRRRFTRARRGRTCKSPRLRTRRRLWKSISRPTPLCSDQTLVGAVPGIARKWQQGVVGPRSHVDAVGDRGVRVLRSPGTSHRGQRAGR